MGWLITFFFLAIGGSVLFGLLDVFLELGFNLFFSVGLPAFIIYSGVKAIKKIIDQNKVKINKSTRKNNSSEDIKIITNLRNYFKNDARLYFDEETYIEPSDPGNINFDTLNIFVRDEYVSSLADYKAAFPSSFNTFIDMVNEYARRSRTKKSASSKPVTDNPTTKTTKKEIAKDAQYYIDKIGELNTSIEEKHITDDLYETVLYLSQIKKIEDTFPKCKEKTTKLYQYYLPMLVEILENYKRLSINADLHKEFKENEDRLLKTLVLINSALKTLTQNLCDEYYTELSVDMKTLETLLKKDGLATDEMTFENFRKNNKKDEQVESNG